MLNRVINIVIIISCSVFGGFFVYNYMLSDKYERYAIIFEEPINGLLNGSQVLLNGIRIGKVASFEILKGSTSKCLVVIRAKNINPQLVEAQLIYLGLAGNKGVNLSFVKEAQVLPKINGLEQIKSSRSLLSKLLDSTESINKQQIEGLVSSANEIATSVKTAIGGISKLINSINELVVKATPIPDDISLLGKNLNKLGNKLVPIVTKLSNEINNENQLDFKEVLSNLRLFSDSIKKLSNKSELVLQQFSKKPIRFIMRGFEEEDDLKKPKKLSDEFLVPSKLMKRIS